MLRRKGARSTPAALPALSHRAVVMNCLHKLLYIAPERLPEAVNLLDKNTIKEVGPVKIADLLSMRDEGIPCAAQLLRDYLRGLAEEERSPTVKSAVVRLLSPKLLRARCWQEVISLLESKGTENLKSEELFYLALAYWGEEGEMPERLCQQALERKTHDTENDDWEDKRGMKGWLLWRVGNVVDAIKSIDQAEVKNRGSLGEPFSLWRLRYVSIEQYLDDCKLVRRMFQGEPLRPALLGPPRSSTAT